MSDEVEQELARLAVKATVGTVAGTVTIDAQQFNVEIRHGDEGYEGFVDHSNFGGGKTPKAAVTKIRKRLEFLTSRSKPDVRVDSDGLGGRAVHDELARREKLDRETHGPRPRGR